ncbi:MAG: hypothetical protein FWF24_00785 [Alphaproteobacteria bacterium]|nr:hypothetical protein [Alphaproteobacteria bacterium]
MPKKRKIKATVYVSLEGKRERAFFDFLYELYDPKTNNINITPSPKYGGNSSTILSQAIKKKNNYNQVYAWFDEDVSLSVEVKQALACAWGRELKDLKHVADKDLQRQLNSKNKNPILIVSSPCSVDGLLLKICGKTIPQQPTTKNCKATMAGIIGGSFDEEKEKQYYRDNLTKEYLENCQDIEALSIILLMFRS